jgi:hypothetical protein
LTPAQIRPFGEEGGCLGQTGGGQPARPVFSQAMILPATPFDLERHMLAPLAEGLPHLLGLGDGRTVRILREPTMGLIIPDLLVGSWRPDLAPRAYAATTLIDAHVRALIERDGVVTPDAIRARLYLSPNAAAAAEGRLVRHGLISRCDTSARDTSATCEGGVRHLTGKENVAWTLTPGAETSGLDIVAIEAKLSRWREAVAQARSYLTFADRAFVVLDGNRVTASAALLGAVTAAGVGLVLQHGRILRLIVPAPVQPPPLTPERVLAVTKLVTPRGGRAFRVSKNRVASGRENATVEHTAALIP